MGVMKNICASEVIQSFFFFNLVWVLLFFQEIKARVFMFAHHWTQSAPDGKAPIDFKGNRIMPMLRALENIKMK